MSADWPKQSLRDAGVMLIDCVHKTPPAVSVGYPYVAIPQMKSGRIDFSDARRISSSDFQEWTKKAHPRTFDIVLSRRCNPGETAAVEEGQEFALGQNLVLLRSDGSKVRPEFLKWLVRGPAWWHQIDKFMNVGAIFSSLKCAEIPKFQLPIPPLTEQQAIADILGSLDDKIELNRRMNATLEGMAQAIFRDWFIDFGPTRRKLAGVNDPVEIMGRLLPDPTLAQALADLFPASFDDSGLPEGWEDGTLEDVALQVNDTISPSGLDPSTPYIGLEHMPRRSIALNSWEGAVKVSSNEARFLTGQILFGKLRPYFHKVGVAPVDGVCSTDIVVLDAAHHSNRALVVSCVSTEEFVAFTDKTSTGTKMPRTSWKAMKTYPLAKAPLAVVETFDALVSPMIDKLLFAVGEEQNLAAMRDLLLPKLISGEIRVGESERTLEDAA